MRIGFFNLTPQQKEYFQQELAEYELNFSDELLSDSSLSNQTNFDIISVFTKSNLTKKVIDNFPGLKMIALRSTGFDNVDLDYAKEKNIVVSNVPAYGAHTVAEFTFGLILSLSRKIPQAIAKVKSEVEFNHEGLKGFELYGKTLGVIGTGKIGANVVKIAKGFGMIILAYDAYPNEQLAKTFEFSYIPLEELLKDADIVTIHVPANPQTRYLINKDNISNMKKGALLINTARGDVVETGALYKAISDGRILGAGLDVLEGETNLNKDLTKEELEPTVMKNILENSYLIRNPSVYVTPHTAFYTTEAEAAIMQTTIENIQGFTAGSPKNVVNNG